MAQGFWSVPLPHGTGLILARPDLPSLFILNPTAAFLWSLYQRNPEDLVQPFASHYGIPIHQAHADITTTLDSWSRTLLLADSAVPNRAREQAVPRSQGNQILDFSLGPIPFRLFIDPHAPDFLDEIRPRLAHLIASPTSPSSDDHRIPLHVTRSPEDTTIGVFANNQPIGTVADAAQARLLLLPEIARLAHLHQSPNAPWFAILHAAALAHPTSHHAVILPAATGSGKSTLATALCCDDQNPFRLLSDDSAALINPHHEQPEILPLPFAVMLRSGAWPLFPQIANAPTHLRYGTDLVRFLPPPYLSHHTALPKHLVFVQYQPDAAALTLHPLDPLQTFLKLQESGFWIPHTRPSISAFVSWVTSLPSYQLTYSHLPSALQTIHSLF